MRDLILDHMKQAMRDKDTRRTATLRLINAAIKDRDIALRGSGKDKADEAEVLDILTKMVKQREESSRMYREAGREELEAQELEEMEIIREYLPRQLSPEEADAAVADAISETGAESLRDMGKVMGILKDRYRGQLDMSVVGPMVKGKLGG
ncbi:MAG: GatB/YqeY domain-containing protein [Pseudomonadota bacterium]